MVMLGKLMAKAPEHLFARRPGSSRVRAPSARKAPEPTSPLMNFDDAYPRQEKRPHRRRFLVIAGAGLALPLAALAQVRPDQEARGSRGLAQSQALPYPPSLRQALAEALSQRSPLVVMVSLEGCPFCRTVRDSHLLPLLREGTTAVVQIDQRSAMPVDDFQGTPVTHDQQTRTWGIRVAPTLLFFGPNAREIAPRLVGASLPDFYGAYLEDRLIQARKALG